MLVPGSAEISYKPTAAHGKGLLNPSIAKPGEPGLVPGSMGTASFLVEGRGAGRALSRTAARRRISVDALERQMAHVFYDHRLARRLVDEAPAAYKDITAVMKAQKPLTRIIRKLTPILSFKGG